MLLLIDNYDSFTYNLFHYLGELGAEITVRRNDEIDVQTAMGLNPSAILLSPGPCDPDQAGICLALIAAAAETRTPLLGVCLGHQAIGQAFGGKVVRAGDRSGQRTDTIMLLHVGNGPNLLMSIPRDSIVDIPGHGSSKINAASAFGGPKLLVRTVEQNTGIRVDHYIEIGFGGVINMVDACELIIQSSLERKESRGPFMRRDFPLQDNERWLVANVMQRTENGFRFEQRPYELPFFQPGFVTRSNLEVAW